MNNPIKNANNINVGNIDYDDKSLIINLFKKPSITITDKKIINCINSKIKNDDIIKELYDTYTLPISVIASIIGVSYRSMYLWIQEIDVKTSARSGMRNSSFNKEFSEDRKRKIGDSRKNKKCINNGIIERFISNTDNIPDGFKLGRLPFSEEHRKNISNAVIEGQKNGTMLTPRDVALKGWENNKYANTNFKKGIGGYMSSNKLKERFFFRSLLELYYIINYVEKNNSIIRYKYEPLQITYFFENKRHIYTPDLLLNDNELIELKSRKFINQNENIKKEFEIKYKSALQYSLENNFIYKVIFDDEIGFESKKFKKYLISNPDIIKNYQIEFLQPERVFGKGYNNAN